MNILRATGLALLLGASAAGLAACDGGEEAASSGAGAPPASAASPAIEIDRGEKREQAAAEGRVLGTGLIQDGRAEAQVVEASRAGGILTVRVRFQRVAAATEGNKTIYGSYDDIRPTIYVVAGDKKYFLLTDTEGKPLTPEDLSLEIYESRPLAGAWWGKFPAPPPEVTRISLVLPEMEPIDVAVS